MINGLGSIIKSLTENLDEEDAQRYDRAINHITSNQNKMKITLQERISLLDKSTQNFKDIAKNQTYNQKVLQTRISIIQDIIKKLKLKEIYNFQLSLIQTTFSQMIPAFQIIYDILAITFSKLSVFYNFIIDLNELFKAIQLINEKIKENKLLFPVTVENMLKFEKNLGN